ncbi:MAG: DUF1697 domain-containing protein [Actinomycetota bacterium]|jgi:uncharacterized protein (DUF1697 family)|nr:DUF1697 domain-containing protein [Actinomycetota bacterium]
MSCCVAFLRAVNVGKRRVAMARLREEFEALGFDEVSTYINSGNVIFSTSLPPHDLEGQIEVRLEEAFGFEVTTFVRTAEEVKEVVAYMPFVAVADGETHMVAFLREPATPAMAQNAQALGSDTDELVVHDREVHWLIHGSFMDTTLKPKHWKALGVQLTTTRNTTMLAKLVAKLES